jgi:O-antigen/teichoic acid export membrane protein
VRANLVWAFIERLAPRGATGLLLIVFAAVSSPTAVGYYAAAMTAFMVLQAVTNGSAEQIATAAVTTEPGMRFLTRYKAWYMFAGCTWMAAVVVGIRLVGAPWLDTLSLLPLIPAPIVMASYLIPLARVQRAGQWRDLSLISATSSAIALCLTLPLVLVFHSALGSTLQLALTELLFAIRVRRKALAAPKVLEPAPAGVSPKYASTFWGMSAFVLGLQGQYQLDRVFVGALGGTATLGLFSFGWSLSRSITDSLQYGTLNVLRAKIVDGTTKTDAEIKDLTLAAVLRSTRLAAITVILVFAAARLVGPRILNSEWDGMLQIAPLMSITGLPAVCCYCLLPALMYYRRMRFATGARIPGLMLAFGIGWASSHSLGTAVLFALVRELVAMAVMAVGARRVTSWRMILLPLAWTAGLWGAVALADALLFAS